jgi:predicted alpha/beta-hydrolase family hydrolase
VGTPVGTARCRTHPAARPTATLVLGHGAGGGTGTPDLQALARTLPGHGVTVVLVDQPWVVAGRKVAAAPPQLDVAWRAVVPSLGVSGPLLVGGRSAGARVACRTALDLGAIGCVALAFPLHPPGRPEKSRLPELVGAGVPTLVVQGANDAFGGPSQFPEGPALVRRVPFADHSFRVAKAAPLTQREAVGMVVEHVRSWLASLLASRPATRPR